MAFKRRRGFSRRGSGSRAVTSWENLPFNVTAAPNSLAAFDITPNFVLATTPAGLVGTSGATVIRAILNLNWSSNVAGTRIWSAGIYVGTEDAFAAGAVPVPDIDITQSWYWWWNETVTRAQADRVLEKQWDIRTSRKLRGNDRLILVVKNSVASETNINMSLAMRLLWKHL